MADPNPWELAARLREAAEGVRGQSIVGDLMLAAADALDKAYPHKRLDITPYRTWDYIDSPESLEAYVQARITDALADGRALRRRLADQVAAMAQIAEDIAREDSGTPGESGTPAK